MHSVCECFLQEDITLTKHLECKSSKSRNRDAGIVKLDGQEIPKNGYFRYDGSIIHKNWEDENVSHRIIV
jgi:hypothetical protein